MDAKNMTRKEFLTLTLTLIGSAAAVSCDEDDTINTTGTAGTGGGPTGGGGGTTGGGGATGSGGSGAATCSSPLPQMQLPDNTFHTHSVTIAATALDATTPQTFVTSSAGHVHEVTLSVANLGTIKSGGSVTVTSTMADGHTHMYTISCQTIP